MLRLARQGGHTLRSPYICTSCRALLASACPSQRRLPGAVPALCGARHYSSKKEEKKEKEVLKRPYKKSYKKSEKKSENTSEKRSGKKSEKTPEKKARKKTDKKADSKPAKKAGKTPQEPEKKQAGPPSTAARLQLWRDTLNVLKDIKTEQTTSPETAPNDPTAPNGGQPALAMDSSGAPGAGQVDGGDSTPANQAKLLEGALVVLKRVLRQELEGDAGELAKEVPKPAPSKKRAVAKPAEAKGLRPHFKSIAEALGFVKSAAVDPAAVEPDAVEQPPKTKTQPKAKPSPPQPNAELGGLQPLVGIWKDAERKRFNVTRIDPRKIKFVPVDKPQPPVPSLAYGLDRVLFNPGVYQIQDPRSGVFNFDPYLARIMPIKEFDFNALKQYVTSSKDTTLIQTAAELGKKYTGSTSSMTSTLAHFHYLLSHWRPINPSMMSKGFEVESHNFTRIMRAPAATFLHWRNGTYAIDADKEFDTANILSMLGKSMEKLLTLPKEEFEKYRKTNSDQLTEEERNGPESFHYTTLGDFLMRSQLDAHDPRLPGTGMFDLKTRAVVTIRMDSRDYHKGLGYEIRKRFGQWESFEREYYDMIRSAFLKYSLQVRMGRMDGIFVAFHNTERIFGFQYIPLQEMDYSLHGQHDLTLGNREFKLSVHLLNEVLNKITKKYPGRSLRLHFETRESGAPFMYIFAKPVTPVEIEEIQETNKAKIEEFERQLLGIGGEEEAAVEVQEEGREVETIDEGEDGVEGAADEVDEEGIEEIEGEEEASNAAWEDVMLKVEDELEDEEHGVTFVRDAVESALRESGLLRATETEEAQRYVDAFLEALISDGRRTTSGDSAPFETAHDQGAEPTETELLPGSTDGTLETDVTQATTSEEAEAVEQPTEELPEKEDVQPSTTNASSAAAVEEPTLKDLIVKLATQIRSAPSKQLHTAPAKEEDETEEALRLRQFSKLLSELKVQPDAEGETAEKGAVVERGSLSAEEVEGVESVKPAETPEPVEATKRVETAEQAEQTEKKDEQAEKGKDVLEKNEQAVDEEVEQAAKRNDDTNPETSEQVAEDERGQVEKADEVKPVGPTERVEPSELCETAKTTEPVDQVEEGQQTVEKKDEQAPATPEAPAPVPSPDQPDAAASTATTFSTKGYVDKADGGELLGMILTIRNKVNGQYVQRPEQLKNSDRWTVEYAIEEMPDERAQNLYGAVLRRRRTLLSGEDRSNWWSTVFGDKLRKYSDRGRRYRELMNERIRSGPIHVYGEEKPFSWEEVFKDAQEGEKTKGKESN
ncbi:hypothetical protein VTI74DRAFT_1444 [Chaetomium olivicolor]